MYAPPNFNINCNSWRKNNAYKKSREAANDSTTANRRAKASFHNTLRNPSLSAKKKFGILLKLMKNNKFSNIPPLVENNVTVNDPSEQSNIFNQCSSPTAQSAEGLLLMEILSVCLSVADNFKPCDWSVWLGLRGCNWESRKLDPTWDMCKPLI